MIVNLRDEFVTISPYEEYVICVLILCVVLQVLFLSMCDV